MQKVLDNTGINQVTFDSTEQQKDLCEGDCIIGRVGESIAWGNSA